MGREFVATEDTRVRRRLEAKKEEVWTEFVTVDGELIRRGAQGAHAGSQGRYYMALQAAGRAAWNWRLAQGQDDGRECR